MKFFTPELYLDTKKDESVAADEWERRITLYREQLKDIPFEMLRTIPMHDTTVVGHRETTDKLILSLYAKTEELIITIIYDLAGKMIKLPFRGEWSLGYNHRESDILYDEIEKDGQSYIHRLLLDDGTEVVIPFTRCQVDRLKII